MLGFAVIIVALLVIWISYWFHVWANPKCNGKLPPGSMGFPLIGETIDFFSPHALYEIPPFITKRMTRYGNLFRTNILGQKVIVSTDADVNYNIFQQENKSFIICYTESFLQIFGQESLISYHGKLHKYLKNLILHLVGPENLRLNILQEMDVATRQHLYSFAGLGSVDIKEVTADMIFDYFSKKILSNEESENSSSKLRGNYKAFLDGLLSFPVNLPGTAFHTCLQGRKNAIKVIEGIYYERKASANKGCNKDFLDHLLGEIEKEDTILTDAIAIDLIFMLLFAIHETTSSAMTLIVKYIADSLDVLAELTKEHETIVRSRVDENSEITWDEYKSMTFTHMVINEALRLANIAPAIFRKAVEDVEINGYTIPAGWLVMVIPSVVHLNPEKYEDPLFFNPWRWQGQELHAGSKAFMAFGGGVRLCAGADLAKLQTAVFLHYFVTRFKFSVIKEGKIIRMPGLMFPDGFHVEITEKI